MKRNKAMPAMKLVEKFDQQLREVLLSDLQAIQNARINLINHIYKNSRQERLMTA